MDKIKNGIEKSRLGRFGHVMQMGEKRIPKKMLHTKMERKRLRGRPRTRLINQIRKDLEIRGKIGKKYKKTGSRRIEMAEDFCVIVDPYIVKT